MILRVVCCQDTLGVCEAMESAIQSIKENATQRGEVVGSKSDDARCKRRKMGTWNIAFDTDFSLNKLSRFVIWL